MTLEEALVKIAELEAITRKFEGIDPETVNSDRKTLSQQLQVKETQLQKREQEFQKLQQQLEQLKSDHEKQISQKEAQFQFSRELSQVGVLPEYSDRFSDVVPNLEFKEGKFFQGDTEFKVASLKEKYPAMFLASVPSGSGATGSTGQPGTSLKSFQAKDGIVSGVDPDDVLSGKVKISV
jgi:hypothetical protein